MELQDEEGFVTIGPLHPQPPQPPRWMGPVPPASSEATPEGSTNGNGMNVNFGGASRWQTHLAPHDPVTANASGFVTSLAAPGSAIVENVVSLIENLSDNVQIATAERPTTELFPILDAISGPALRSVIVGPSAAHEPMVTVVPLLLNKVFFHIP